MTNTNKVFASARTDRRVIPVDKESDRADETRSISERTSLYLYRSFYLACNLSVGFSLPPPGVRVKVYALPTLPMTMDVTPMYNNHDLLFSTLNPDVFVILGASGTMPGPVIFLDSIHPDDGENSYR